ncbi:MAG: hypothetical protein KAX66_00175 [Propionivibrio sp.]|nr:hypothetical protein [Propionivibrio sp.]
MSSKILGGMFVLCCVSIAGCSGGAIWPFNTPYMQVRLLCKNVAGAAESWQSYRLAPENINNKAVLAEQSPAEMRKSAREYHARLMESRPDEAVLNRLYLRELNRAIDTFLKNEDMPASELRDLTLNRCKDQAEDMELELE